METSRRRRLLPLGIVLLGLTVMGVALVRSSNPRVAGIRDRVLDRILSVVVPSAGQGYWVVEDADARGELPEFQTIPGVPFDSASGHVEAPQNEFASWERSNGGDFSSKYSDLEEIDTGNVCRLSLLWEYRADQPQHGIEANPIFADGKLFTPGPNHDLLALDAATGELIWRYEGGPGTRPAPRGLTFWGGDRRTAGRVYFHEGDDLVALNASDGTPASGFGPGGRAPTGQAKVAPAIFRDAILTATFEPAVKSLDLRSGKLNWETSLIARPRPRVGGRRNRLSRGNPWGGISIDVERSLLFITTGNPGPEHVGTHRPGDNDHANSVRAYDARTGRLVWSFQETRHDLWDLDIPAPPVLGSVTVDRRRIDIVTVATKAGNVLLLDRETGRPVFDFRLRRVPTSTIPGERTAPYQPSPTLPEPLIPRAFSESLITDIGEEATSYARDRVTGMNYGFYVPPEPYVPHIVFTHGGAEWPGAALDNRTSTLFVATNFVPFELLIENDFVFDDDELWSGAGRDTYKVRCSACHGADREGESGPALLRLAERKSMDEIRRTIRTGSKSMPAVELGADEESALIDYLVKIDDRIEAAIASGGSPNFHQYHYTRRARLLDEEGYPLSKPPWGQLSAVSLSTGRMEWQVPLGEYEELSERGRPVTGRENFGGPVATAGDLVFVGGADDRVFRAFDSRSGREVWRHDLPAANIGSPLTYLMDGRQYVVVTAMGGGVLEADVGGSVLAFGLSEDSTHCGTPD